MQTKPNTKWIEAAPTELTRGLYGYGGQNLTYDGLRVVRFLVELELPAKCGECGQEKP
jgi:hypothetical protein